MKFKKFTVPETAERERGMKEEKYEDKKSKDIESDFHCLNKNCFKLISYKD